jgi:hypothetical protein
VLVVCAGGGAHTFSLGAPPPPLYRLKAEGQGESRELERARPFHPMSYSCTPSRSVYRGALSYLDHVYVYQYELPGSLLL